jgi:hypothetical protein
MGAVVAELAGLARAARVVGVGVVAAVRGGARLGDDAAGEEGVRSVDAVVDHDDHLAAAPRACGPGLRRADQRYALGDVALRLRVHLDGGDESARDQRVELARVDLHRRERALTNWPDVRDADRGRRAPDLVLRARDVYLRDTLLPDGAGPG